MVVHQIAHLLALFFTQEQFHSDNESVSQYIMWSDGEK